MATSLGKTLVVYPSSSAQGNILAVPGRNDKVSHGMVGGLQYEREKKMGWIRKMRYKLADVLYPEGNDVVEREPDRKHTPDDVLGGLETIGIEVHRAEGGLAIISTVYDDRSSEWKKRLHVVATEDASDIAETVSHIITMRALGQ